MQGCNQDFFCIMHAKGVHKRRKREWERAREEVSPSRRGGWGTSPEKILASRIPVDAIWAPLKALFDGVLEAFFICKVNKTMEFTGFWPTVSTPQQVYWTILDFFYITHLRIVRNGRYALAMFSNGFLHRVIEIQDCVVQGKLFTTQSRLLMTLLKEPFENIVGKGENAGNQHFLLCPQCFLPFPKQI